MKERCFAVAALFYFSCSDGVFFSLSVGTRQAGDIQVETPKRGRTHLCTTIQPTTIPTKTRTQRRSSIFFFSNRFSFADGII